MFPLFTKPPGGNTRFQKRVGGEGWGEVVVKYQTMVHFFGHKHPCFGALDPLNSTHATWAHF